LNINNRGHTRCGRNNKVILKSDRVLWLLCLSVFISVAILTLRWLSILDCHYCGQLRADYIRGQVYLGAGISPIRE
jgi:hypothetical protein